MFDDLRQAWRQAVENFRRELDAEDDAPVGQSGVHLYRMRRDVAAARSVLDRLATERTRAERDLERERQEEDTCRRREGQARNIGDEETAQIAAEYAARHAERAAVLARKIEVLVAEHALNARELAEMEQALETRSAEARENLGPGAGSRSGAGAVGGGPPSDEGDTEFHRLEREAREKAADARLDELKRRMQR